MHVDKEKKLLAFLSLTFGAIAVMKHKCKTRLFTMGTFSLIQKSCQESVVWNMPMASLNTNFLATHVVFLSCQQASDLHDCIIALIHYPRFDVVH